MNRLHLYLIILLPAAVLWGCLAAAGGNVYPLPKEYHRWETLLQAETSLANGYPGLVKLHIIGFSGTEHLPLHALQIGRGGKRKALIVGQHHGDEVLGVETALAWAKELAAKANTDRDIRRILDEFEFWVVPTLNPEAFRAVTSGEIQFLRKNKRETDGRKAYDPRSDGVDLNRNYPVFWDEGAILAGSHRNYKGPAPMSESEVAALIQLAQQISFETAIFFHSSMTGALSEKVFLPAIDPASAAQKERYARVVTIAQAYADRTKKDYLRGKYEVGKTYSSREGNARNYFFHIHSTAAFLVELGGVNKDGISVIHPSPKKLRSVLKTQVNALRGLYLDLARGRL